jgi:hypothetical protein
MWNSAKLASGAKATSTTVRPSAQRLAHRGGLQPLAFEQFGVFGRHDDPQTREQGHDIDGEGDEEWVAPAPAEEVFRRQIADEERKQGAGDDEPERCAELRDHRVPAAAVFRRIQRQQRGKPVPCSAQGQSLADPEHRQQPGRSRADLVVTRHEGDRHGRGSQKEQRDGQFGAASVGPVNRREDRRADRPRDEGKREDAE